MSSIDELPPAWPAMWRALKRGYEAEPRLLSVAFGMSLLASQRPYRATIATTSAGSPSMGISRGQVRVGRRSSPDVAKGRRRGLF